MQNCTVPFALLLLASPLKGRRISRQPLHSFHALLTEKTEKIDKRGMFRFLVNAIVLPVVLASQAVTWYRNDWVLQSSLEARKFLDKYFVDCPVSQAEHNQTWNSLYEIYDTIGL